MKRTHTKLWYLHLQNSPARKLLLYLSDESSTITGTVFMWGETNESDQTEQECFLLFLQPKACHRTLLPSCYCLIYRLQGAFTFHLCHNPLRVNFESALIYMSLGLILQWEISWINVHISKWENGNAEKLADFVICTQRKVVEAIFNACLLPLDAWAVSKISQLLYT